jgi:ADP-ribose pyrophosphatase YjhB (NUDIX family)
MWGAIVRQMTGSRGPFCVLGSDMASDTDTFSNDVRRDGSPWLERIARAFRRFPWLARTTQRGMRLIQPRFTVGVVGVLLDASGERVLLVEHVFHAVRPWGMPGGWINRNEDPAHAVEREFLEETGLRVRAVCPLVIRLATDIRGHMDMIYLCELDGAREPIRLSKELLGYRWTPLDDLPPLGADQREALRAAREIGQRA